MSENVAGDAAPAKPSTEYTGERRAPARAWQMQVPVPMASMGGWWFGAAMLVATFAIVIGVGWFSGAREVAYAIFLGAATVAFFPVLIMLLAFVIPLLILSFMAFLLVISILASLLGGGDVGVEVPGVELLDTSPLIEFGSGIFVPYYTAIASIRHPGIWGSVMGTLAGAGALMLTLNSYVLAPEKDSTAMLLEVSHRLEQIYDEKKAYPRPTDSNQLTWESLGVADQAGPVLDGFDRPLVYTVTGVSRVATWELRSVGFDGEPGTADDLVLQGSTRLARLAGHLGVEQLKSDPSHTDLVVALRAMRGSSPE